MARQLVISGLNIYLEDKVLTQSALLGGGVIQEIGDITVAPAAEVLEFPATWHLIPGMIDLHIHGAAGADTMDATAESLQIISGALIKEGVTSFLSTTVTASSAEIEAALANVKTAVAANDCVGAQILGVNLEGPFLSTTKAGAQTAARMLPPDIEQFAKWQKISGDLIKLVTVAPELDGAMELINYLVHNNVVAALGHSNATYEQAQVAIAAGVTEATHLFNAMRAIHHRDPGDAVALLLSDQVMVEVIADGLHLHPAMLQLVLKMKGPEHIIMITDAMRAKQLVDGEYSLGEQQVIVQGGAARLADGTFAGSILTMDQAVRNMLQFTDCSLCDICKMAALNPARQLGVAQRKGSIAVGKDADLVIMDDNYNVMLTIVAGKILYRSPVL